MKNSAIQFLLHLSRTSLNRKRHSNLRFAPRLSWLSHFSRPALSTFAPHLPRLPAFLDSPSVPFDSRPNLPRLSRSTPLVFRVLRAFPLAENANRGPDCKENVPVWQKTSLGGLIRQEMRRPLDHIGKDPLLPRRKTAGQRIVHHELPQDSQNPNLATRPPSGVFCQMNPASPQCPLESPSKQSDWRAFRAICPASLPNDLPGEFTQAVLHASHGHRQAKRPRAGGEFGNAYRNGSMMLARTNPPTSRHQPRRRPFPFSRKPRARFPCDWQKPTHERNGHERFLEQARRQTRKRSPQPSPTSIATRKEEPWARNTTEELEPTKGS